MSSHALRDLYKNLTFIEKSSTRSETIYINGKEVSLFVIIL